MKSQVQQKELREMKKKSSKIENESHIWDKTQVPKPRNLHADLSCSCFLLDKEVIVLFCVPAYLGQ